MANQQPLNKHQAPGTPDDPSVLPYPGNRQPAEALPSTCEKVDLEPDVALASLIENWIDA